MNCGACHHGESLGALNWPLNKTLVESYIHSGKMPPGTRLSVDELTALHDFIIKEHFETSDAHPGLLKAWLTERHQVMPECFRALLDPSFK